MSTDIYPESLLKSFQERRFFKLICGGSFSDPERLKQLIEIYALAGVTAIDISATSYITDAAIEVLKNLDMPPLLMVSLPLDEDPHFRKIEWNASTCINCGKCIPVCPSNVFTMSYEHMLQLNKPVCYGCGRCIEACPVKALNLGSFEMDSDLTAVLSKPEVEAVEIHTNMADINMFDRLYESIGNYLSSKIISVCLRPNIITLNRTVTFLADLKNRTPYPLIVQVDGIPMSASDNPDASLPALNMARELADNLPENCFLTVSGGINSHTADYLKMPEYYDIQGIGMGTYARQKIWNFLSNPAEAIQIAKSLVTLFQSETKLAIMK